MRLGVKIIIKEKKLRRKIKLVIGAVLALGFVFPGRVSAANLFISPVSGEYEAGGRFSVSVKVNTENAAINAIDGTLDFGKDLLEAVSISKKDSIITLWIQEPVFSNKNGTVAFGGLVLNPGYQGISGTVLTIEFKVRKEGSGQINLSSGSVLANDGYGTNVLKSLSGSFFVFTKKEGPGSQSVPAKSSSLVPQIFSPTHPEPTKWYSNNDPIFQWLVPAGVKALKLVFARNPESAPFVLYQPPISQKELADINDGVWYFKAQFIKENGEAPIAKFRFNIDTVRPDDFEIIRIDDDPINPRPELLFESHDQTSGIDRYEIKVDKDDWLAVKKEDPDKPYQLPLQLPGRHELLVRAFDQADNYSSASYAFEIESIKPAPVIKEVIVKGWRDKKLIVRGKAETADKVIVYISNEDLKESSFSEEKTIAHKKETVPEADRNWIVEIDNFKGGHYSIYAHSQDARGAISAKSNVLTVKIGLASEIISLTVVVSILFSIFAFVWLLWPHKSVILKKLKIGGGQLKTSLRLVVNERALIKNLRELSQDIEKELGLLKKIAEERALLPQEDYLKTKLNQYKKIIAALSRNFR